MNWLQRTALAGIKAAARTLKLTDHDLGKFIGGGSTYTGRTVSEQSAMQQSAVWACVRIIAETIGSLPLAVYEKDRAGNATKVDHPLSEVLIGSPNADMTSLEYREAKSTNLALVGNGYSLIDRNGAGNISSLYPIESRKVDPRRRDDGTIYYRINDRGRWEEYPQEKIWHVKGIGGNGLIGYSPIKAAMEAIGIGLSAEEFQGRFFAQGARPSMIAKIPGWLDEKQRPIARENLQQLLGGQSNFHRVPLLEGGVDVTPTGMPLEEAQFLELRGFSVQEICRFYRMPPHMVADMSASTNNNIEQQTMDFVMFTMQPWFSRFEASAQKWLLKPGERSRFFVRFNVDGLLRADAQGRAQLYATLLQNGVYSRNEVRALENRNRSDAEGMDDFTVQSNMAFVQLLEAFQASQQSRRTGQP